MKEKKCCICKEAIEIQRFTWSEGRSAEPVTSGRCCRACYLNTVLPGKIAELKKEIEQGTQGENPMKKNKCSICGEAIEIQRFGNGHSWSEGHNAEPVASGSCCGVCNIAVVIPARKAQLVKRRLQNEKPVQ